jgi:CheY-like chemotaxis protein
MAINRVMGKRVLVADDEPGVREAFKLLLGLDRHTVTEAASGQEALVLYEPRKFDLVITDYAMPGMAGDQVVSSIKDVSPEQPIILATAHAERFPPAQRAADVVLRKPFVFDELRRAIWNAFRNK